MRQRQDLRQGAGPYETDLRFTSIAAIVEELHDRFLPAASA